MKCFSDIFMRLSVTVIFAVSHSNNVIANENCDLSKNVCKPLKECTVLYELLGGTGSLLTPEVLEKLEDSKCEPGDTSSDVCCPMQETEPRTDEGVKTETRFGESFNFCQTPIRQQGSCIPIRNCVPLMRLVAQPSQLTRENYKFLRQSQCGYLNGSPYVCCASESNNVNSRQQLPARQQPSLLPTFDKCGVLSSDRIFGGRNAKVDEYPWLAIINYVDTMTQRQGQHCGGSLISARYVLTAAHCLSGVSIPSRYTPMSIRLGEWDTTTTEDCDYSSGSDDCVDQPIQDIPIERYIVHERYRLQDVNTLNDIALIRMKWAASFNFYVSPICLPSTPQLKALDLVGKSFDVAGWGLTELGHKSNIKKKVDVPVISNESCQRIFTSKRLTPQQLCAGGVEGKDSCNGDSGGPLMKEYSDGRKQYMLLLGIVSYGNQKCGVAGYPGVYTKVSAYVDWINANIQS